MRATDAMIRFRVALVDPQRIEIRDPSGRVRSVIDVPTGMEVRIVGAPWWVRGRLWGRARVNRWIAAWGAR